MHKREGRLDLEGLAFVVLLLARTRRGRIRTEGAWMTKQVKTARRGSKVRRGSAGFAYGTPISASVVGDVLLALTGQPLGSDSLVPESSPRQIRAPDALGSGIGAVARGAFDSESRNTSASRSAYPYAALQSPGQREQARAQAAPATEKGMAACDIPRSNPQVHQKKARGSVDGDSEQLDGNVLTSIGRTHEKFVELKDATGQAGKSEVSAVPGKEPLTSSLVHQNSMPEHVSGDADGTRFHGRLGILRNEYANDNVDGTGSGHEGERSRGNEDEAGAVPAMDTAADGVCVKAEDEHGDRSYVNEGVCVVSREDCKRGGAQSRDLPCGTREASQVLTKNKRQLEAIFNSFAGSTGSKREMLLPDVLDFCDAFELRPGLINTGQILEAYKKVMFPGEMDVTDEEIGYRRPRPRPQLGSSRRARSTPPSRSSRLGHEDHSAGLGAINGVGSTWSLSADDDADRRSRSRGSTDWSRSRGAEKRNVYIGRDQRFPLRQLRHAKLQSASRGNMHETKAVPGGGNQFNAGSTNFDQPPTAISEDLPVESGTRDSKFRGPGLSQLQFMEWLEEVAIGPSNLSGTSRKKTSRLSGIEGGPGASVSRVSGKHGSRTTVGTEFAKNSKALALLQWMELSYGMKMFRIPAFRLRYDY